MAITWTLGLCSNYQKLVFLAAENRRGTSKHILGFVYYSAKKPQQKATHTMVPKSAESLRTCSSMTLRVQVPSNHILTQNLWHNDQYPNPKYLIIGYLDP